MIMSFPTSRNSKFVEDIFLCSRLFFFFPDLLTGYFCESTFLMVKNGLKLLKNGDLHNFVVHDIFVCVIDMN